MNEILVKYEVDKQEIPSFPPFPQQSECNKYGFLKKFYDEDLVSFCDEPTPKEDHRNELRIRKFQDMKTYYETNHVFHKKLKDRVRKGLPHEVRKDYYMMILQHQLQSVSMDFMSTIDSLYHKVEFLPNDNQIDLDVKRTNGSHYLYQENYKYAKRELFLILRAISQIEVELGYTQGMNDVCGMIYNVLLEKNSTLQLFYIIMENPYYDLKQNVLDLFPGVKEYEKLHNLVMKYLHPTVYNHLVSLGYKDLPMPSFLFEWYMVWFCRILPVDMTYYVIDRMLFDGKKALLTVGSALLFFLKDELLKQKDLFIAIQLMKAPTEFILKHFSCKDLIQYCYKHKVTEKMLNKWLSEEAE